MLRASFEVSDHSLSACLNRCRLTWRSFKTCVDMHWNSVAENGTICGSRKSLRSHGPSLCNPMYLIDQRFSHVSFDFQEHLQSTFFCIIESLHISASEFGENVWSQSCGLTSAGFCRHAAALGAPCVCHF